MNDPGELPPPSIPYRPPATIAALRTIAERHELFSNLVRRDLRIRYRRSVLGWGWSLAQPLLISLVYVVVLGQFFRITPEPGNPSGLRVYAFFMLAGVLPWNFLSGGMTTAMASLATSAGVITKVAMPRELIPVSAVTGLALSLCVELTVMALMEAATGHVMLHLLPIGALLVALQFLFVAGLGLWLSALNIRYRDVQHLTGVLLTVWMYLTPILYSPSLIPAHKTALGIEVPVRSIFLANPMARFTIAYRHVFYDFRLPDLGTLAWCAGWSAVAFLLGYRFFRRRSPFFVEDL